MLSAQLLEERRVMDAMGLLDGNFFQNPLLAADVNDDQVVTANDALVVINELARQDTPSLEGRLPSSHAFFDVNGDNNASAVDALQVINQVARQIDPPADSAEQLEVSFEGEDVEPISGVSRLRVEVENLSEVDGLFNTPVWVGFHDGGFDLGQLGQATSQASGLELLAEEGDVSEVRSRFASDSGGVDGVVLAPEGFAGAPVFDPAEIASSEFDISDSTAQRYFSFASMVIPSNDAFIGNLAQRQFEIFNEAGDFLGPRTITIYGSDVFDAGTEVNAASGGAAFSTEGGESADEGGVIARLDQIDEFVGTGLPNGTTLGRAFAANTPIARITISPAENPGSASDSQGPRASLANDAIVTTSRDRIDVRTIISDASGVDVTSVDPSDVRLLRLTGGPRELIEAVSVSSSDVPGFITRNAPVSFSFNAVDGVWDAEDNGTYRVYVLDDAIADVAGNGNSFKQIGDVEVAIDDSPVELTVQVENLSPDGGLFQTPFWVGTHDGSFEVARLGQSADGFGGLEEIAEEGDVSQLVDRFAAESNGADGVIVSPAGFTGAPVFDPGEIASTNLSIEQPAVTPFFSFASMVIPSNDAFLANLNSEAYRLFDDLGQFNGPLTITLFGSDVWDAGTEVNAADGGAAFSSEGGTPTDEGGIIRLHDGLDGFVNTGLPTGETLESAFNSRTPIARITINLAGESLVPVDEEAPAVLATVQEVTEEIDSIVIDVNYVDPSGVDASTITANSIVIVGPAGNRLSPSSVVVLPTDPADARSVTASFTIDGPSGTWSNADNATYTIELGSDLVADVGGNELTNAELGSFDVAIPIESAEVTVSIENLSPDGGLFQTPFWIALHDGNFDLGTLGESAAGFSGLEAIAETGDASGLVDRFAAEGSGVDAVVTSPGGFDGAPVFDPGEVATGSLTVANPGENSYFSFASMVIPSNDAFLANLNSRAYRLFDSLGQFNGPITIDLFGSDVWDAGTEVNDPQGGAAFSTEGGDSADEGGVISSLSDLDNFVGTGLPTGESLGIAFTAQTPIARVTINLAGQPTTPVDSTGPIADAEVSDIRSPTNSHAVSVTYNDPSGVNASTISVNDILLASRNTDAVFQASSVVVLPTDSARTVTATFNFDGPFNASHNGSVDVVAVGGGVADTLGNSISSQSLGSFSVNVATPPASLEVFVENLSTEGGLYLTPFFVGVHNGSFQIAELGRSAVEFEGLESIAEEGDASGLVNRFADSSSGSSAVVTAPDGFAGAPVFDPGDEAVATLSIDNPAQNRFFSFASMLIPSNDAFFANLNSTAYELFNDDGQFSGPLTIDLYGADVWDAGTEENIAGGGAAFSALGGEAVDEASVISPHQGLDNFVATVLPTGADLLFAELGRTPLARITISLSSSPSQPIDDSAPLASLASLSGANTQNLIVEYSDPSGIDLGSISQSDLLLVPVGDDLASGLRIASVGTEFVGNDSSPGLVRATYSLESGDDSSSPFSGTYRVILLADEVVDSLGNESEIQVLGTVTF